MGSVVTWTRVGWLAIVTKMEGKTVSSTNRLDEGRETSGGQPDMMCEVV